MKLYRFTLISISICTVIPAEARPSKALRVATCPLTSLIESGTGSAIQRERLTNGDFFDGPPEGRKPLAPGIDSRKGAHNYEAWDFEGEPNGVWMKCEYGADGRSPTVRRLDRRVKQCELSFTMTNGSVSRIISVACHR